MSHLLEILNRLCDGYADHDDLALMERIGLNMRIGSMCGHGQLGFNPVRSALQAFGDEFLSQINSGGISGTDPFIGPRAALRGAQLGGATPTGVVHPNFVARS